MLKRRVRDASYKGFESVLKQKDTLLFCHNQYTGFKFVLRRRHSLVFLSKILYGIYPPPSSSQARFKVVLQLGI